MSDTGNTKNTSNSSNGPRRNGQNRSRNNRNYNNRNRNNSNRGGNRQQRSGRRPGRRTPPPPPKLSWWKKLLVALGLQKAPKTRGGLPNNQGSKKKEQAQPPKSKNSKSRVSVPSEKKKEKPPVNVETTRLHVGNLSYDATEGDIKELFMGVGAVRNVEIIYNSQTHRSRGYGFIDMQQITEAKRAVEVLHDQFFMGRKISVNPAKASSGGRTNKKEQAE